MPEGLLPLFPLQVVLLPGLPLPLHIFEDRYKELIREAIRDQTEFGVVLAKDDGILNTGCTAVVEKVLKRYPDGRMDVLARGKRRFEIVLLDSEKPYLRGSVEFFDDEEAGPAPAEMQQQALAAYRALAQLEEEEAAREPSPDDPQLSFRLAQLVRDLEFRQVLLRTRSEPERMKQLAEFLSGYLPKQRYVRHVRRAAPTNGHGRHSPSLPDTSE
jgi:Lon protease-like protein